MKRMRFVVVIALVMAAGLTAFLLRPAQAAGEPVKIMLEAENSSGETGTATLTDLGNGKTMVDVEITGAPDGAVQPVDIHEGQCGPTLGKVTFPLTNLEKGKSSTTVDAALDTFMTGGFAIDGHKSAQEISVDVFCGNIPESDAMMMAHETATDEAMVMEHATATTEAMMMAHETATDEAMAMTHATATTEAMMMADATATDQAMAMTHATATTEAMMMADATATDQAMAMTHATATTEAMMMADATATDAAMAMEHATATTEAMMMADATATDAAMAMTHATATTEAMMMAQATSTEEAMMAQVTATPAAASAAENATPTASAPVTIPTTGGTDGSNWLLVLAVFGLIALGAGIGIRQTTRKS